MGKILKYMVIDQVRSQDGWILANNEVVVFDTIAYTFSIYSFLPMSREQIKKIVTREIHVMFFQTVKYTDVTIIVIFMIL